MRSPDVGLSKRPRTEDAPSSGDLMRPVAKRLRDPVASGAIFKASPAALRSPMPRLFVREEHGTPQAQQPSNVPARPQPTIHGSLTPNRFSTVESRFYELYSKSPMPKVLADKNQAKEAAASTPKATPVPVFATPTPRQRTTASLGHVHTSPSKTRITAPQVAIRTPVNITGKESVPSPSAMSEDMDIEEPSPLVKPNRRGSEQSDSRSPTEDKQSAHDEQEDELSNREPDTHKAKKAAPKPAKGRKSADEALAAHGAAAGQEDTSRRPRSKAKVLAKWNVRFRENSKGATGFYVEGYLVNTASGIAHTSDTSLQWKTSFIQDRETATRVRTATGSLYVLQGAMDPSPATASNLPEDLLERFRSGFPEDFHELEEEVRQRLAALQALQAEEEEEEQGEEEETHASGAGGAAKRGGRPDGKGAEERGSREKAAAVPRTPGGKEEGGGGEEGAEGAARVDVGALSTSRSGRKLLRPVDYWRQENPVYEGAGADRQLVGVEEGKPNLIASPMSGFKRRAAAGEGARGRGKQGARAAQKGVKGVKEGGVRKGGKSEKGGGKAVRATAAAGQREKRAGAKGKGQGAKARQPAGKGGKRRGRDVAQEEEEEEEEEEMTVEEAEAALAGGDGGEAERGEGGGGGGQGWDAAADAALLAAYRGARVGREDFWGQVAAAVEGRSAQECCDRYNAAYPTPAAQRRKAVGTRRRPNTPKKGREKEKEKERGGDEEERGEGGGAVQGGEEEEQGGGEEEEEQDALVLRGNKGTTLRKRELRKVLTAADEGHEDDIFDATPFKGTPFRQVSNMAKMLAPSSAVAAPPPAVAHASHAGGGAASIPPGMSPGLLRTPGVEGRDGMDAYIDRVRVRARRGAAENRGARRHGAEGPAAGWRKGKGSELAAGFRKLQEGSVEEAGEDGDEVERDVGESDELDEE